MLNDVLPVEELRTADSVAEANRLLDEGWELLGFHAAPAGGFASSATIFVLAKLDWDEEPVLEDLEARLNPYFPQS